MEFKNILIFVIFLLPGCTYHTIREEQAIRKNLASEPESWYPVLGYGYILEQIEKIPKNSLVVLELNNGKVFLTQFKEVSKMPVGGEAIILVKSSEDVLSKFFYVSEIEKINVRRQ
jgi:hypothetical protein